jgi:hypothetical protein
MDVCKTRHSLKTLVWIFTWLSTARSEFESQMSVVLRFSRGVQDVLLFKHMSVDSSSTYSGRKITESLGNVTVRGEKKWKGKREARRRRVCLSMYSITENIYYSRLSSVVLLLQSERNFFTSCSTRKGLRSLSSCAIALWSSPPSHVSACNGQ